MAIATVSKPSHQKWKKVDHALHKIESMSDDALLKEYNEHRVKELTAPILKLQN